MYASVLDEFEGKGALPHKRRAVARRPHMLGRQEIADRETHGKAD
jgi:hypothetical protein